MYSRKLKNTYFLRQEDNITAQYLESETQMYVCSLTRQLSTTVTQGEPMHSFAWLHSTSPTSSDLLLIFLWPTHKLDQLTRASKAHFCSATWTSYLVSDLNNFMRDQTSTKDSARKKHKLKTRPLSAETESFKWNRLSASHLNILYQICIFNKY